MLRGLRLAESLRAKGFPAPRAVATIAGDLLAAVDGDRYQVSDWVDGQCFHPGDLPLACVGPMGELLGQFHRLTQVQPYGAPHIFTPPAVALDRCRELLDRYTDSPEPFARVAQEILQAQTDLLLVLPSDYAERLSLPRLNGTCYNSFGVEQLLFRPDGGVAALVDWTDGAGAASFWVEDVDRGIHLSAFGIEEIKAFVAGYQSQNPLPESEWRALVDMLCYGHLASTNYLSGWFARPYRRMSDWEITAERWHRLVPDRFRARHEILTVVMEAIR